MEDEDVLLNNEHLLNEDSGFGEVGVTQFKYEAIPPELLATVRAEVIDEQDAERRVGPIRPINERPSVGTTWYKAIFLIVNAALGAGLLNFPFAFNETGGVLPGNLVHVIFVLFSFGALAILAICALEKNCKTYQEVVKSQCGPKWAVVASLCITCYCFFTAVTFIMVIGDQFDTAFASFFGSDFCLRWYLNRRFTMVVPCLFLIFPSFLKRIDGLEFMSYVGVASIVYVVIVIVIEMVGGTYERGEVLISNINLVDFFNVSPTILFGYQCHVSSVPILSCLKKKEKTAFLKACGTAILICFLVYTIAANCGYLTFGSLVSSDIFLNYDARKFYILIAAALLAIKSWTTYPILLFCMREAVSDLYLHMFRINESDAIAGEPRRRKTIAAILWFASIVVAVFFPGLSTVVKLLGSLAGVFILIFPGMCFMNSILRRNEMGHPMGLNQWILIVISAIYIILGCFTLGLSLTLGIEGFIFPGKESPVCVIPDVKILFFSSIF